MRLKGVSFANWVRRPNHAAKDPDERWLRELYPWPVLAQVECGESHVDISQLIRHDGATFEATLQFARWQPRHGTFKYRILIESEGLGWHSRAFSDRYDMCGTPDGKFVTVFHTSKREPLERIARSFFGRRWKELSSRDFKSLAVSRFLAASIVSHLGEQAYGRERRLEHYPGARIAGGQSPMLADESDFWMGFRFGSQQAFEWARKNADRAKELVCLYFADTKHQFNTALPVHASVRSASQIDAEVGGGCEDLIRSLLRRMELPTEAIPFADVTEVVHGRKQSPAVPISEHDVTEALAALKRPCHSKAELRYQLAAGVVLNAWIERERALGYRQRKKFYAFKKRIGWLLRWLIENPMPGVLYWVEQPPRSSQEITFVRIDEVDFSFHAIAGARDLAHDGPEALSWTGVRLKPIAPLVLVWARHLLETDKAEAEP